MNQVVFRGKTFTVTGGDGTLPIVKQFLIQIGGECELSAAQLEKHAVFLCNKQGGGGEIFDAATPTGEWSKQVVHMHLAQVCSVCQIDAKNDIGAEYDGAVFTLFCGHTLHRACFEKMENKTCPLCRNAVLQQPPPVQQNEPPIAFSVSADRNIHVPKWSTEENSHYLIAQEQTVAFPVGHGMMILHSEPMSGANRYRFLVRMAEDIYCSAALLLRKQPASLCDFGRDFHVCKPLRENMSRKTVYFNVDMSTRVAQYHFGNPNYITTLCNLPPTVYLACVTKHCEATICSLSQF